MPRTRPAPSRPGLADREATALLVAPLADRERPPDDDLRALLMALRRGYLLQARAIDNYLGLPPARSGRAR